MKGVNKMHIGTKRLKGGGKFSSIMSLALALGTLYGCEQKSSGTDASLQSPGSDQVEKAGLPPDDSYVSLTGVVVQASDSTFLLDYGDGVVTVEMDDWDAFKEGRAIMLNDEVIVYGYIDRDFYEQKKIEAGSVYVKDLGTQFYANAADEEDFPVFPLLDREPAIRVSGKVVSVGADEFELETPAGRLDVNVEHMGYDPLDSEGFQRIQKGDRVSVYGYFGKELFEDLDLMAQTVTTIRKGKSST